MFLVVTYDITDDQRRMRVASEMENYGKRVQFSVFECHLPKEKAIELQHRIDSLIIKEEDQVRYYTLCQKDAENVLVDGPGEVTKDWDFFIV